MRSISRGSACTDIMPGVRTAAKDRDVTNAAIGEEPLDGGVRAGGIADYDRQFMVDDDAEPFFHEQRELPDRQGTGNKDRGCMRRNIGSVVCNGHGW